VFQRRTRASRSRSMAADLMGWCTHPPRHLPHSRARCACRAWREWRGDLAGAVEGVGDAVDVQRLQLLKKGLHRAPCEARALRAARHPPRACGGRARDRPW